MRLAVQPIKKLAATDNGAGRLSAFGQGLPRAPSQKELAGILKVTTRHLRRWEMAEEAANRPCSRPYSHADLWRLYQRRGGKGWDKTFAAQLGLSDVFERFDQMRDGCREAGSRHPRSDMAAMMLRSVATDGEESGVGDGLTPRIFSSGLAVAAKTQLRVILDCDRAREVLVKAFFEAALVAEAQPSHIRAVVVEASTTAISA